MRVRVSDAEAAGELRRHLADQGFPSSWVRGDELDVLFPASPCAFESAAELDLWQARHEGVTLAYVDASQSR